MKTFKNIAIVSLNIIILTSSCSVSQRQNRGIDRAFQLKMAKEFAFAYCLKESYKNEGIDFADKDISPSVYIDIGDISPELTKAISRMAKAAADSIRPIQIADYGNKKAIVLRCMEFMNNKTLADTIKMYKRKNR